MDEATPVNQPVRRALLVATAVVAGAWLLLIVLWSDAPFALTFDDAWYYLTIGRNLADGKGSTFDGINLTNGYHPLWQGVATLPFVAGLDDLAAARALLVIQLLVGWGLTLVFVSATVARVLEGWPPASRKHGERAGADRAGALTLAVALVLVAGNPYIVKVFVNGLESGIAATCDAALLYLAVRCGGRWLDGTRAWRLGVGALLAVTFLARTDAIFLLATLGLWCLALAWRDRPSGWVLRLVELFAIPGVVVVGYLAVNQRLFGTPVQVSGLVKRAELTPATIVVFAVFLGIAGALAWVAWRPAPPRAGRFPLAGRFARLTGWFAAFCVLLVGYYSVLQVQQWLWYYAPVVLYFVVLLLLAVADMMTVALRDAPAGATAGRALLPVRVVVGVVLVLLLAFTAPQFFDPQQRSILLANAATAEWLRANLSDDARIASWDAGALGYFSHRSVVNIDGVVNSYDYYEAGREGRAPAFWRCQQLTHVANHGADVEGEDPDIRRFLAENLGRPAGDQARVVHRNPFEYAGALASTGGTRSGAGQQLAVHVYEVAGSAGC